MRTDEWNRKLGGIWDAGLPSGLGSYGGSWLGATRTIDG